MARTFSPWEVEKQWLIHPSVHDQVPPAHFAHLVCDLVREILDLEAIASAYDKEVRTSPTWPAMMTALLIYAWCENTHSSRRIAKACEQRIDFMALTAMEQPDFVAIRKFRDRHAEALVGALVRFFRTCARLSLPYGPKVDDEDDGEKTMMGFGRAADPFEDEARRWVDRSRLMDEEEDARFGADARGDEVPKWVADKSKRLRRLKDVSFVLDEEDVKRAAAKRALADDDDDDDFDEPPPREPVGRRSRRAEPEPEPVPAAPPEADHPLTSRRLERVRALGARHGADARPPEREEPPRGVRPRTGDPRGAPPPRGGDPQRGGASEEPRGRGRGEPMSRGGTGAAGMPDTFMTKRPESERLMLVEALVGVALADGEIAAIEQRRIDQMMRTLRLDARSRQRVLATMRDGSTPDLPTPRDLPDYDARLHIFEQAAVLALTDGLVHPDEQRHLRLLAMSLELDVEDAKLALRRANEVNRG